MGVAQDAYLLAREVEDNKGQLMGHLVYARPP